MRILGLFFVMFIFTATACERSYEQDFAEFKKNIIKEVNEYKDNPKNDSPEKVDYLVTSFFSKYHDSLETKEFIEAVLVDTVLNSNRVYNEDGTFEYKNAEGLVNYLSTIAATELYPGLSAKAHTALAEYYVAAEIDYPTAIGLVEDALEMNLRRNLEQQTQEMLANLYFAEEKYGKAIPYFEHAENISEMSKYHLWVSYDVLDMDEKAENLYNELLNSPNKEVRELAEQITIYD